MARSGPAVNGSGRRRSATIDVGERHNGVCHRSEGAPEDRCRATRLHPLHPRQVIRSTSDGRVCDYARAGAARQATRSGNIGGRSHRRIRASNALLRWSDSRLMPAPRSWKRIAIDPVAGVEVTLNSTTPTASIGCAACQFAASDHRGAALLGSAGDGAAALRHLPVSPHHLAAVRRRRHGPLPPAEKLRRLMHW